MYRCMGASCLRLSKVLLLFLLGSVTNNNMTIVVVPLSWGSNPEMWTCVRFIPQMNGARDIIIYVQFSIQC